MAYIQEGDMTTFLLLTSLIILLCVFSSRFADRTGMPVLLCFIGLGMLFGADGPLGIYYENLELTERICSVALAFVMFYGGFGTNWKSAKPVAVKAVILSFMGVVLTALSLTLFCTFVLKMNPLEGFLIGSVLSSTDAASVFSILRSKKLSLKYGTASLLEIESGSNDPISFMLTTAAIALITGTKTNIGYMMFTQIVFGGLIGVSIAVLAIVLLKRTSFIPQGLDTIFIVAIVLASYALPSLVGGNGYLSVYLTGIILGNSSIRNKKILVPFFDGITNLAQICIFFILGLLSFPTRLPSVFLIAMAIALFLLFIGRPITVFLLMTPFKAGFKQQCCISWAGLRGASSIVFAIYAVSNISNLENDLFHIVFMVSLLSVALQGTLLPSVASTLNMIDHDGDVLKTFNDYQEDSSLTMMRMFIPAGHNWENRLIGEVSLPTDSLALMIRRGDETIIPRGNTRLHAGDSIIFSVPQVNDPGEINLREISISDMHEWANKKIEDLALPSKVLIAMIRRGDENIIPRGKTVILPGDIVVIYDI